MSRAKELLMRIAGGTPRRFRTSDGYTLFLDKGVWTDGEMVFLADPDDGWPIEDNGDRLEGRYVE